VIHQFAEVSASLECTQTDTLSSAQGRAHSPRDSVKFVDSVHERRCKAEESDEMQLKSREVSRRGANSRKSEIRSRISGKETADPVKEREKMGPGDD